ncbi:MAG: hypothetical protein ACOYES_03945 [Bacillota bacterium]
MSKKLTVWISLAVLLAFGLAAAVPGQAIDVEPDDDSPADDEEDSGAVVDPNPDPEDDEDLDDDPEDELDDDDELELGADKTVFFERLMAAYPELAVTVEQLQALFDAGWGLGDLAICAVISADSGKSFEDVLALAEGGMGWGEVAKESGIEARNLGQAVSAAMGKKGLLWKGHEQDVDESIQKNRGRGNAYGHDPQHRGGQPDGESDESKSQGKGQGNNQGKGQGNSGGKANNKDGGKTKK